MIWLIRVAALLEGFSLTLIQGYLPLYVRRALEEPSFVTVGAVIAIPSLGTILASNFWGGLSDVSGRLKPFILIGLVGYAAVLAAIPLLHDGPMVLLLVGVGSLFFGTHAPTLKTYVTLAQPGRREHTLAYLLLFQSLGWLAGSATGARLLSGGLSRGFHLALQISAGLAAVHAVILAIWLRDRRHRPPEPLGVTRRERTWLSGLAADLASLYDNRRLLRLCTIAFFMVSANYTVWGFFSVYYTERLGASYDLLGATLAVSAVSGITMFFFVPRIVRRLGAHRALAAATLAYVVMYVAFASTRNPIVLAAFFALPVYSFSVVATNALATEYSTTEQRGGGLGVLNGAYALAAVAGPLTAGLLADRHGLGAIPYTALAFILVAAAFALAGLRTAGSPSVSRRNAD